MDSIGSMSVSGPDFHEMPKKLAAKQNENGLYEDKVVISGNDKNKAGFTDLPDIRIPTTTEVFPKTEKEKVLNLLKPGDIVLATNDAFPSWQIVEKIMVGTDYTHAAIYEGDGKFLEAAPGSKAGVRQSGLEGYFQGPSKIEVIRPPYKSEKDVKIALDYAKSKIGRPFDQNFDTYDDKEYYCSELIYKSLRAMPDPMEIPLSGVLGKNVVSPDAFERIPGASVIYSNHASFAKSMLSHHPVIEAAALGASVGAALLGIPGAICGFATGGLLAILAGNKIQTGRFGIFYKSEF